jgi:hypothetical protein
MQNVHQQSFILNCAQLTTLDSHCSCQELYYSFYYVTQLIKLMFGGYLKLEL